MGKNYAVIIQFVLPLTTFYRPRAQRSDVYKQDSFVTPWRFHNRAWQLRRHDRLPETSGTLWIHRGALTNQRCSLATRCGINFFLSNCLFILNFSYPWQVYVTACFGRLCDVVPGYGVVSVNFRGPGARPGARPSWQVVSRVELSVWRVVFRLSGPSDPSPESVCSVMSHAWDSMWRGHGTLAQSAPSRPFEERVTETWGQTLCLYIFHIINTENWNSRVVLRERNRLATIV